MKIAFERPKWLMVKVMMFSFALIVGFGAQNATSATWPI